MDLNQVTLPATDLYRSAGFYTKLGLKLIVFTNEYARFKVPDGNSTLSLHVEGAPAQPAPRIYFECTDLDERVAQLKSLGIAFEQDPKSQRWGWRDATLYDPAGNLIILYLAGEIRLKPLWAITDDERAEILSKIAELG